ncbi:hypothetical protein [Shouchella clausii]|uniref:hypothetical protein n=1 Tax=Shouchella clausii TaxID=79880 RepID=UPI001652FC3F|nr:hypothetical protein [Shouchella clausii]QNM43760.1 hypothetical protein DUT88_13020 [Shouchella clausii]
MKLFLVTRSNKDAIDYDEYDSFVIRAEDEKGVREVLRGIKDELTVFGNEVDYIDKMLISELDHSGRQGIICASFNAG